MISVKKLRYPAILNVSHSTFIYLFFILVTKLYFKKEAETGKYLCQIKDCQSGSFFPNNTTLMKHLFRVHHLKPKIIQKISKIIDCEGVSIAPKLSKISFDLVNENLALSLATSIAPYRLVENRFFIEALSTLNSAYTPPSHQTISRIIDNKFNEHIDVIISTIKSVSFVSLSADFWTGKDHFGYLGMTLKYIDPRENERKEVLICLKYAPHPHTANNVLQLVNEILKKFTILDGMSDSKIVSISTDNGSNMVAAFDQEFNITESIHTAYITV